MATRNYDQAPQAPENPSAKSIGQYSGELAVARNGHFIRTGEIATDTDALTVDNYRAGANYGASSVISALERTGVEVDYEALAAAMGEEFEEKEIARDRMKDLNPLLSRGVIGFGEA